MPAPDVRSARLDDVDQLASLFNRLGHPRTADTLSGTLEVALADPRASVLVADDGTALLGAATLFFMPVAHDRRS